MNKLDIAGNKLSLSRVPTSSAAMLLKPSAASPVTGAAAAGTGYTHINVYIHTYIAVYIYNSCTFKHSKQLLFRASLPLPSPQLSQFSPCGMS